MNCNYNRLKLSLFFLLTFSFIFSNYSQNNSLILKRQINWYITSTYDSNFASKNLMTFDNCIYNTNYNFLPIYYEEIPLNEANDAEINIQQLEYQPLNTYEYNLLSYDVNKIKNNEIKINSEIIYNKKRPSLIINFLPFRLNPTSGDVEKLISFEIILSYRINKNKKLKRQYINSSVLATGTWYKIAVSSTGIYKITYENLISAGVSLPVASDNIKLFGNGGGMLPEKNNLFRYDDLQENAIWVEDGGDGIFGPGDYILFYGESANKWQYNKNTNYFNHINHLYSDLNFYFLTTNGTSPGKRITLIPSPNTPVTDVVNKFNDYAYHDKDSLNLMKSGKIWFGEKFDVLTSYNFSFNFPNIVTSSVATLNVDVAANSPVISSFLIKVDNNNISSIMVQPILSGFSSDYAQMANDTIKFLPSSDNINVTISYNKPVSSSIGWLNYIELNVMRNLIMTGGQMCFRNTESIGPGKVTEFHISGANNLLKIWDVTDPINVGLIQGNLVGNNFIFKAKTDSLKEFIAYDDSYFLKVSRITPIANQNLHGLGQYDMVIITYPDFISEALRLANYHTIKSGLSVLVVFPESIYNEFSSGKQDISAIRDFIKMFYDRATNENELPKYLLLFGDGSYDPKLRISENTNFIPTFQSLNSTQLTSSYVSDDFYGLLDDGEGYECNGALDIGIGRLPVKTIEEAKAVVDKIIRYLDNSNETAQNGGCNVFLSSIQPLGDWRNIICFIADDEDNNLHFSQAEALASIVESENKQINIEKIYLDAYQQQIFSGGQRYPDVNDAINKRVERGALIINYTGHGGEVGWAHERILELSDINKWKNKNNMPVFVTATCEFSRFDDPVRTSAGEYVLLNGNGGGVALFTTTRLSFSNTNFNLNKSFYQQVFKKVNGEYLKMGDIIRLSKIANGSNANIRNFILLGDPALNVALPRLKVVTTQVPDTIKALSNVTINGYIADEYSNKITNFNGVININIFDKPSTVTTLGNDPTSYPASFSIQKNIIYKGKASVNNGDFSFSFIVPKDISYKFGNGRISYYAEDNYTDAAGYYENFIIGGANLNAFGDNEGPEIKLYINDTLFKDGGITDENPVLLAYIKDYSGINTVGNGIGHDIVAILDGNTEKSYILNDYYEADIDTYKSGVIKFPFSNLTEGLHTIKLKVWDVYNNSSEAYIKFIVSSSSDIIITKIITYPNPFSESVSFVFEHNQPCCQLDINIEIYSIMGQLVKTINTSVETSGYVTLPITWNAISNDGKFVGPGFYIYKLTVKNKEGKVYNLNGICYII
ncbi:MAG TPA: type IX secretion system sortase PorU, partial [Bacteroidales bacterium]|nr:type IX secretion system sortase PorU [Bacteroidales bacterium]